jgi:small-conductance mechanosensitive channel
MESYENYEDLKNSTKSFLQFVTSDNLHYGLFLIIILVVGSKLIEILFKPLKKRGNILLNFVLGCIQALWVFAIGIKICSLSPTLSGFGSQILMSSSLLVVVLGFVFQEGLTNIVHGFILMVFKPFKIGDRVKVSVNGETVTGYIKSLDLRSTIIQNVLNSSHVIVPNSQMDTCVIENSYFDSHTASTNFLDFSITYESNLEKAIAITAQEVAAHPFVQAAMQEYHIEGPVPVMVRNLEESGVAIRATVITSTVEQNFAACSDLRRQLVWRFTQEPDVDFAYMHVQLVSDQGVYAQKHM